MDVEEHPGGAVSNYVAISDTVKHMQERVDAMRACHSYYISHAYTQARGIPCEATVPLAMPTFYSILGPNFHCHLYYTPHAYTQARSVPCKVTKPLPAVPASCCSLGFRDPCCFPTRTCQCELLSLGSWR